MKKGTHAAAPTTDETNGVEKLLNQNDSAVREHQLRSEAERIQATLIHAAQTMAQLKQEEKNVQQIAQLEVSAIKQRIATIEKITNELIHTEEDRSTTPTLENQSTPNNEKSTTLSLRYRVRLDW